MEGGWQDSAVRRWNSKMSPNEREKCLPIFHSIRFPSFLSVYLSVYLSICLSFFLLKNWEWNIFIRHHNLLRSFVLSFETKTLHNREWVRATILKLTLLQHFSFMASFHTSIKMSKSQTQTVTSCKKWVSNVYLTFGIRLWSWSLNLTKQQNY